MDYCLFLVDEKDQSSKVYGFCYNCGKLGEEKGEKFHQEIKLRENTNSVKIGLTIRRAR